MTMPGLFHGVCHLTKVDLLHILLTAALVRWMQTLQYQQRGPYNNAVTSKQGTAFMGNSSESESCPNMGVYNSDICF